MLRLTIIQLMFFLLIIIIQVGCEKDSTTIGNNIVEVNSNIDLSLKQQIAQKVLQKTNTIRASRNLSELVQNNDMDQLARLHSENMIEHNFFDHLDHQNKSPSDRADDLSFGWTRIAENIGYVPWFENVLGCGDTRTAESISECVVEGWRNSPGHYANMIGDFSELGVGVAFTNDSIAYFTQVFRTP